MLLHLFVIKLIVDLKTMFLLTQEYELKLELLR